VPASVATVRAQFDARAARFDAHDTVIREVGSRLLDRLQYIRLDPRRVLDVGCGAGNVLPALAARFPSATLAGLDVSEAMLGRRAGARRLRRPRWLGGRPPLAIAADAARLPVAADAIDLVFSNLMLHWHPAPHTLFPEWKRVLAVGGLLLFSCFGPDTLKELRAACRATLPHARPMPFIDMHDFGDMMVASGLADPVMDAEVLTLTYASPHALLREARALGGNPRADRYAALPSGRQARSLLDALAARPGDDGRVRLTFEVAYGHAWKPAPRPDGTVVSVEALRADLAQRRRPPHRASPTLNNHRERTQWD
jgi:malonyl-CoA O-methyltransferase